MKQFRRISLITILAVGGIGLLLAIANPWRHSEMEMQVKAIADHYMIKDTSLLNQFSIERRGLEMWAIDKKTLEKKLEAVIYWEEVPLFRKLLYGLSTDSLLKLYQQKGEESWEAEKFASIPEPSPGFRLHHDIEQPLKGLRVALDPGHMGGTMEFAQFEEKFIKVKANPGQGIPQEVGFNEGNIALGTALLLAEKLRKEGAEVLLTREVEGKSGFGGSYDDWLAGERSKHETFLREHHRAIPLVDDLKEWSMRCAAANTIREKHIEGRDSVWLMTKAKDSQIYRKCFLPAEFKERARKINDFKPHLTFIIHYNVHESNMAGDEGYRKTTSENYCMAFIPGSFMAGELMEPEDRLAFAAKLLTDDIRNSQNLSKHVVAAHERLLDVPAIVWDDSLGYLINASIQTPDKAVFARNLQLTRLINGTLCFGESLYQDNTQETNRLNAKDFTLPGMTTPLPNRIRQVADAYYEGLLAWLTE